MSEFSPTKIISSGTTTPLGSDSNTCFARIHGSMPEIKTVDIDEDTSILAAKIDDDLLPIAPESLTQSGMHPRYQRMLRIAQSAFADNASKIRITSATPIFLGMPQEDSAAAQEEQKVFIPWLNNLCGKVIDTSNSRYFPHGRASGLIALYSAIEYLNQSDSDIAIVGAVDSMQDPRIIQKLLDEDKIMVTGNPNGNQGMIPSEGAVFLTLCKHGPATKPSIIDIKCAPIEVEEENEDITAKIAEFIEPINSLEEEIGNTYPPLNGEEQWISEWGYCMQTLYKKIDPENNMVIPAYSCGDLGAAHALFSLAACADSQEHGLTNNASFIYTASDTAHRAYVVVN